MVRALAQQRMNEIVDLLSRFSAALLEGRRELDSTHIDAAIEGLDGHYRDSVAFAQLRESWAQLRALVTNDTDDERVIEALIDVQRLASAIASTQVEVTERIDSLVESMDESQRAALDESIERREYIWFGEFYSNPEVGKQHVIEALEGGANLIAHSIDLGRGSVSFVASSSDEAVANDLRENLGLEIGAVVEIERGELQPDVDLFTEETPDLAPIPLDMRRLEQALILAYRSSVRHTEAQLAFHAILEATSIRSGLVIERVLGSLASSYSVSLTQRGPDVGIPAVVASYLEGAVGRIVSEIAGQHRDDSPKEETQRYEIGFGRSKTMMSLIVSSGDKAFDFRGLEQQTASYMETIGARLIDRSTTREARVTIHLSIGDLPIHVYLCVNGGEYVAIPVAFVTRKVSTSLVHLSRSPYGRDFAIYAGKAFPIAHGGEHGKEVALNEYGGNQYAVIGEQFLGPYLGYAQGGPGKRIRVPQAVGDLRLVIES